MEDAVRVAFIIDRENLQWTGGKNYLSNLTSSVAEFSNKSLKIILFVSHDISEKYTSDLIFDEIVKTRLVNPRGLRRVIGLLGQRLFGRNFILEWLSWRHRIDRFSHIGPAGRFSPLKIMTWIPDFQDLYFPGFFSEAERSRRSGFYKEAARDSYRIILSSETARDDFIRMYPKAKERARVLSFATKLTQVATDISVKDVLSKYSINHPYFHLPNQLWVHKNHRVVIQALNILKARGLDTSVVSTGASFDLRRPHMLDELQNYAKELDVADRIQFLGQIPYSDLVGLMGSSVAVINPSLFEGWSTTVEEAKSLGKLVIASDIPVHREQGAVRCLFFQPGDASELAETMARVLSEFDDSGEGFDALNLKLYLNENVRAFAETYQRICLDSPNRP